MRLVPQSPVLSHFHNIDIYLTAVKTQLLQEFNALLSFLYKKSTCVYGRDIKENLVLIKQSK